MRLVLNAAVVAPAEPVHLVQLYSVGADFMALGYALVVVLGLVVMALFALLTVLIGRR